MKLETVRSDIVKFEAAAALSLNDVLGIMQDLGADIRRECGHATEDCASADVSDLTSKLIWTGNLLTKIAARHEAELSAESRYTRLREKLAALEQQSAGYLQAESQLRQMQERVAQLENEASLRQQAQRQIAALTDQKEQLERDLRQLEGLDPAQLQSEVDSLSRQLHARQEELSHLRDQRAQLQAQTDDRKEQLQTLRDEIAVAEPALRQLEDETVQWKARRGDMEERRKQIAQTRAALEAGEQDYTALQEEQDALQEEQEALELRRQTLEKLLADLRPQVERLRGEKESLEQHASGLSIEESQLKSDNARLEEDNQKKSEQVEARRQNNETLQRQNRELVNQVREQEQRLVQLETLEKPQLENRLKQVRDGIADCERRQTELNQEIHAAEEERSGALDDLSRLNAQLEKINADKEEAREKQEYISKKISSTNAVVEGLRRDIERVSRMLEQQDERGLRDELDQQQKLLELRTKQCDQARSDLAGLQQQLDSTAFRLEALKQETIDKTARMQQVEQEYCQACQEAERIALRDPELAEQDKRLHQLRDVADALRIDTRLLAQVDGQTPFVLDELLADSVQRAAATITALRQAIREYQNICGS